ncbi:MAG: 50S ribosomal protein L32 [Planctomycetes bacterium]|nr:50S ribosomal protein L32 [Planctomycetota bacterium]
MPNPKRRTSKARKNKRRSHHALQPVALVACRQCGAKKRGHTVCSACGHYDRDKPIILQSSEAS